MHMQKYFQSNVKQLRIESIKASYFLGVVIRDIDSSLMEIQTKQLISDFGLFVKFEYDSLFLFKTLCPNGLLLCPPMPNSQKSIAKSLPNSEKALNTPF